MARDQRSIYPWQRDALEPFAGLYRGMVAIVRGLTDAELEAARLALLACSPTNCSWDQFRTAKVILPEIAEEQANRKRETAT